MARPRLIDAKFESQCKSCDDPIHVGDKVHWLAGVGAWHEVCPPPRSADMYAREAERLKKLGLDFEGGFGNE